MSELIVVTGAASGIGRSVCELLVADGQAVIGLDQFAPELPGVEPLVCDLADSGAIARAVRSLGPRLGGLVNCAGLPGTHAAERVLTVNLLAPRRLSEALVDRLTPGSAVVNVASIAALRSPHDAAAVLRAPDPQALEWLAGAGLDGPETYNFSKKALAAMTLVHSARWLPRGVRCVSVSPGPTNTPILPDFEASMGADRIRASAETVGGHAEPEDVAAVIVFLLGRGARWVNGIDIRVDHGLIATRLAP